MRPCQISSSNFTVVILAKDSQFIFPPRLFWFTLVSRSLCRFLSSIRHLFSRVSLQWGEKANGGQNTLKNFKNHLRLELDRKSHLNLHENHISISWSNKALQKSHLLLNHGFWLWYHVNINWEREFKIFSFFLIFTDWFFAVQTWVDIYSALLTNYQTNKQHTDSCLRIQLTKKHSLVRTLTGM